MDLHRWRLPNWDKQQDNGTNDGRAQYPFRLRGQACDSIFSQGRLGF